MALTAEQMIEELRGLPTRAQGFASIDMWRRVADLLYEGFTDNFARAADAEGNPWPPRKSKKATNPLLILTGLLIRSVGGHGESIYSAKPMGLTLGVVGDRVPYAAIHNEGTDRMPQREYMNVSAGVEHAAADAFVDSYTAHLFPPQTA